MAQEEPEPGLGSIHVWMVAFLLLFIAGIILGWIWLIYTGVERTLEHEAQQKIETIRDREATYFAEHGEYTADPVVLGWRDPEYGCDYSIRLVSQDGDAPDFEARADCYDSSRYVTFVYVGNRDEPAHFVGSYGKPGLNR